MFTPAWSVVPGEVATATKMSQLGANDDYLKDAIDNGIPAGIIAGFAGSTEPDGWLICDGRTVSRSTYSDLFAAIGTSHGAGDGSTTFAIPDFRERVMVGRKSGSAEFGTIGQTGGDKTVILSEAQMPHHSHYVNDPGHSHSTRDRWFMDAGGAGNLNMSGGGNGYARGLQTVGVNGSGTGIWLNGTGGNQAHTNIQPYGTENVIIKY
jgi:microcystin-dependent protein